MNAVVSTPIEETGTLVSPLPTQKKDSHGSVLLKVKYTSKAEPCAYLEFDDENAMKDKVESLKSNPQVESFSLFSRRWVQTKTLTWLMSE